VEATVLAALAGRTERFGFVRLWGSVGTIVTLLAVGVLLDHQPATMLIPTLAVMLLLVLGVSLAIPGRHLTPPHTARQDWRSSFKQPGLIAFLASCFCMMMAHGALFSFLTLHLVAYGYSKLVVGMLWTLGFLAEIGGFAILRSLFQRYSYRTIILMSFAAAVVRFTAIAWAASSLPILAVAQLLHALTFATYHGASVALIQHLFPGDLGARGQALYSGVTFGLGGVCGTLLAGWTWQMAGPQAAFTLSAAFCAVGGAIVLLWLPRATLSAQAK
jgi:MFS transporter, PPP family, 3-phenylpropionic acid transporter